MDSSSVFDLPPRSVRVPGSYHRGSPRLYQGFRVTLREGSNGGESAVVFRGVDISFHGMRCVGSEPMWPGNVAEFTLRQADEDETAALTVRGRVIDLVPVAGEVGMRVRFECISPTVRQRIAQWIGRRLGSI